MIPPIGGQLAAAHLLPAASTADPAPPAQANPNRPAQGGDSPATVPEGAKPAKSMMDPPPSSLEKALESVNDSLKAWSTGLRFDTDEDTHHLVVSIVDSTTGDVLRKIPSDAMLRVAKMIVQFQGGGVDTEA